MSSTPSARNAGWTNDVGEIRRVLNSFLQMIEQDRSHGLVVAATNHPGILDPALFRRFDDILHYDLPNKVQIAILLKTRLTGSTAGDIKWEHLADFAAGLSYAEITRAANEALKDALIHDRARVRAKDIQAMLEETKTHCRKADPESLTLQILSRATFFPQVLIASSITRYKPLVQCSDSSRTRHPARLCVLPVS